MEKSVLRHLLSSRGDMFFVAVVHAESIPSSKNWQKKIKYPPLNLLYILHKDGSLKGESSEMNDI